MIRIDLTLLVKWQFTLKNVSVRPWGYTSITIPLELQTWCTQSSESYGKVAMSSEDSDTQT
jgi:hypothetical protein